MRRTLLLLLTMGGYFWSNDARAADGWSQLKVGMTQREAGAVLGSALVTSSGRGFAIAIYDHRGEVVYHAGRVIAWTAPVSSAGAAVAPAEGWQFGGAVAPVPQQVIPDARGGVRPGGRRTLPEYRR